MRQPPVRPLLTFLAGLLLGAPLHAEPLSRSEALLAGLEIPASLNDYPAELVLPASWMPTLAKLAEQSETGDREVGICVNLTATADRDNQLQNSLHDYAHAFATNTPRQDPGGKLAAHVAAVLQQPGHRAQLTLGELQSGQHKHIVTSCTGTNVGGFHTHPQLYHSYAALSDRDTNGLINGGEVFTGVVSGQQLCLQLSDGNRRPHPDNQLPLYALANLYTGLNPQAGISPHAQALAAYAARSDGAVYCGAIGRHIPRTLPPAIDWSAPEQHRIAALAMKAWLMTIAQEHRNWPALSFSFTPTLDEPFWKYLKSVSSSASWQKLSAQRNNGDLALFSALVREIPATRTEWSNGFTYPDSRDNPSDQPLRQFTCTSEACTLDLVTSQSHSHNAIYWLNQGFFAHTDDGAANSPARSRDNLRLQIKSWLITQKWREHPEWPALDFAYTPELGDDFWQYLSRIIPNAEAELRQSSDAQILAALQRQLPSSSAVGWTDGLNANDPGDALLLYSFHCRADACAVTTVSRSNYFSHKADPSRAAWFENGSYYLVDNVDGQDRMIRFDSEGGTYQGAAVLINQEWQASGQGVLDVKSYRYSGGFEHNAPSGSGRVYDKKEQRWYSASASKGKIQLLAPEEKSGRADRKEQRADATGVDAKEMKEKTGK